MLLAQDEQPLNARLLDMAGLLARRHAAAVTDVDVLAGRAAALLRRCARRDGHIAGIQRSGCSPGGLQLRSVTPIDRVAATTTLAEAEAEADAAPASPHEATTGHQRLD